jgi:dTDP-4-dehydrorhamnose 3,5-epimerase
MDVRNTAIPDIRILAPKKHGDHRGFFSETYKESAWKDAGLSLIHWVQDNHSYSPIKGTVRGLHFQSPPFAVDKLVRVSRGAILDVCVDIRKGSPTYGKHVAEVISADAWNQILVPKGFAHGFCSLEPDTEVIYKMSGLYAPQNDHGLAWDDPALGIKWPVTESEATLSDRDRKHPKLAELPEYFGA